MTFWCTACCHHEDSYFVCVLLDCLLSVVPLTNVKALLVVGGGRQHKETERSPWKSETGELSVMPRRKKLHTLATGTSTTVVSTRYL
jgi:hypothetical protein